MYQLIQLGQIAQQQNCKMLKYMDRVNLTRLNDWSFEEEMI